MDTNTQNPQAPVVAPQPTSEKLTQLNTELHAAKVELRQTEIDSPEEAEVSTRIHKLKSDIVAEIAAIKQAEIAAKDAEARNAKVTELMDLIQMSKDNDAMQADKKADPAKKDELNQAFKTALDGVVNQLAGGRKATVKVADGSAAPAKGSKSAAILASYQEYVSAGMTDSEARKKLISVDNWNDGTVGNVIKSYLDSLKTAV